MRPLTEQMIETKLKIYELLSIHSDWRTQGSTMLNINLIRHLG